MQWQPPQLWQIVARMCVPQPTEHVTHDNPTNASRWFSSVLSCVPNAMPATQFQGLPHVRKTLILCTKSPTCGLTLRVETHVLRSSLTDLEPRLFVLTGHSWRTSPRPTGCARLVANASDSGAQLLVASHGACLDSSTRPMSQECLVQSLLLRELAVRQTIHPETPIVLRAMPSSRHLGCVFSCVWHLLIHHWRLCCSLQAMTTTVLLRIRSLSPPVFASEQTLPCLGGRAEVWE